MPLTVAGIHIAFLVGVVVFAHHLAVFMGLFLFFLGYTEAYARHQNPLILREGLLVAFFLAGTGGAGRPSAVVAAAADPSNPQRSTCSPRRSRPLPTMPRSPIWPRWSKAFRKSSSTPSWPER